MAAKRKEKSIRRTTKGKGANYRPTKKGAGMTRKVLKLTERKILDLNLKQLLQVKLKKAVKLLKDVNLIVHVLQVK